MEQAQNIPNKNTKENQQYRQIQIKLSQTNNQINTNVPTPQNIDTLKQQIKINDLKDIQNKKEDTLKRQRDKQQDILLKKEGAKSILKKKRNLLSFQDQIEPIQNQTNKLHKQNLNKQSVKGNLKNLKKQTQIIQSTENDGSTIQSQLKKEFMKQSQRLKQQIFQLSYSYWDGKDVVKKIKKKKKQKVIDLLEICRLQLIQNFQVLAKFEAHQLLFVIKDFIAPHHITIAQLQLLSLKTRTGEPIFEFHSVKVKQNLKQIEISVNFGGPIRIVQKSKYQKNKVIYPFCNWHTLDVAKIK